MHVAAKLRLRVRGDGGDPRLIVSKAECAPETRRIEYLLSGK
jgi:hypothetical protein